MLQLGLALLNLASPPPTSQVSDLDINDNETTKHQERLEIKPVLQRATEAHLAALEQQALPDWTPPTRNDLNENIDAIAPQNYFHFGPQDQDLTTTVQQASIHGEQPSEVQFGLEHDTTEVREQRSKLVQENLQRLQQAAAFINHVVFAKKRRQLQQLTERHPISNWQLPIEVTISQQQTVTSARLLGTSGNAEVDRWIQGVLIHFFSQHESIGLPPLKKFRAQEVILLNLSASKTLCITRASNAETFVPADRFQWVDHLLEIRVG